MTPNERLTLRAMSRSDLLRTVSASDLTRLAHQADAAMALRAEQLCLADRDFTSVAVIKADIEDEQIRRRTAR